MDDVIRAKLAADLLGNDVLKQALDVIENEIVELWGDCPTRDKEGKEELWRLYKTAKKFRGVLTGYVQAGKLPRLQATPFEKMKDAVGMK